MSRLRFVLALMSASLLGLAACSANGASAGSDSQVTIGYMNNGSVDPAQAALSLGMYKKYVGGNVKMVKFDSGPAALTALGSGDVDIMTGIGNPPVASALSNHVPISVIWADELGQTDQALIVKKNSGINTVSDLKGKQVATVVGSTSSYALSAVLKKNGMSDSDVQVRNMDPQTLLTAWTKGQISAAYIWDPVLGQLLAKDAVKLADNTDVQNVAPIFNFSVANKDWAASHKAAVTQFIKAQDQGLKAFRNDPQKTLQAMMKDTGETAQDAHIAATAAKAFDATHQLDPQALGPDDQHSLAATSLLAASAYLHSLDGSQSQLQPADVSIDRSFVQDYLKETGS